MTRNLSLWDGNGGKGRFREGGLWLVCGGNHLRRRARWGFRTERRIRLFLQGLRTPISQRQEGK